MIIKKKMEIPILIMQYGHFYKFWWILGTIYIIAFLLLVSLYPPLPTPHWRSVAFVVSQYLMALAMVAIPVRALLINICVWSKIEVSTGSMKHTLLGRTSEINLNDPVTVRFVRMGAKRHSLPQYPQMFPMFRKIGGDWPCGLPKDINQITCSGWIAEVRQGEQCILINPPALIPRIKPDEAPGALGEICKAYIDAGRM
jgi:hypothetical protein